MKIYAVGGCVRDFLLGVPQVDKDYVVIGATAQQMIALGYEQVGADFPVFLHPQTKDEYALARVERKQGDGYHGFLVGTENVTLEEDLLRRDLTINAMAMSEDGDLVDPYGGRNDLKAKVLRHVSPAFAEDPVRVLRLLRFHARLGPQWTVAEETQALIARMIQEGALHHLTKERVWKEVSRALHEPHAQLFLDGLVDLGLHLLPAFVGYRQVNASFISKVEGGTSARSTETLFSLAFAFSQPSEPYPSSIPGSVRDTARAYNTMREFCKKGTTKRSAAECHALMLKTDAFKSGENFCHALEALSESNPDEAALLRRARLSALSVDKKAITAAMPPGPEVGKAIGEAQRQAIAEMLGSA